MFRVRRGQSTLEYVILLTVVVGALLGIQNYFKRGLQGRWKSAMDELGDQYDKDTTNSTVLHTIVSNAATYVTTMNSVNGIWTFRSDSSNSLETKSGFITVGGY